MKKLATLLKKNLKWLICLLALILFIAIIRSVYKDNIMDFDNFYYEYISKLISPQMTFFVKVITNLASAFSLISLTILILLVPKDKKYGILVGINLMTIFIINTILKFIFARPRPLDINLIEELGYSFPSAHAMISTAFYGFIIYLIWQMKIPKRRKWISTTLLSILIILIGITRIYLGVHYASDVFAGMLISISYLVLFTSIASKYLYKNNKKSSR